jgi:hypothetical protein
MSAQAVPDPNETVKKKADAKRMPYVGSMPY